jgi:hypothetical protein
MSAGSDRKDVGQPRFGGGKPSDTELLCNRGPVHGRAMEQDNAVTAQALVEHLESRPPLMTLGMVLPGTRSATKGAHRASPNGDSSSSRTRARNCPPSAP